MFESLIVLKYDSLSSADIWLNNNPGVAVCGETRLKDICRTKMYFSKLLTKAEIAQIIEFFPNVIYINPEEFSHLRNFPHALYSGMSDRSEIIKVFRSLGATVQTSPCCIEIPSFEEAQEQLQELQIRLGRPLSQIPISEISQLYGKIY